MVKYDCYNRDNENNYLLNAYHVIRSFIFSPITLIVLQNGQHLAFIEEKTDTPRSSLLFKVTMTVKGESQNSNAGCVAQEVMFFPVHDTITQNGNKENNNNNAYV